MRKLSILILSLTLVLSSLFYVGLNIIEDSGILFEEVIESDEFMHEMRHEMGIDAFIESVPFFQDELNDIFKQIEESPETKVIVKQVSEMMLVDMIQESVSFDAREFMNSVFSGFENHIKEYDNEVVNFILKLFKSFMVENVDQFNLEDHYEQMLEKKRSEFSKFELKSMKLLFTLYEEVDAYKKISFSMMASSFGLLAVLSLFALFKSINILLLINVFTGLMLVYITKEKGYPIDARYTLHFGLMLVVLSIILRLFRKKKTA